MKVTMRKEDKKVIRNYVSCIKIIPKEGNKVDVILKASFNATLDWSEENVDSVVIENPLNSSFYD